MELRWPFGHPLNLMKLVVVLALFLQCRPSLPEAQPTPTPLPSTAYSNSDRLALLSFKSLATTGPALSSWNDSVGFCDWPGVTCGVKHPDRVVALSLKALDLGGTISPSLANLTFLGSLHLTQTKVHGVIPTEIGNLRRLRYLNLSVNSLEGPIPANLSRCSELEYVCLGKNNLAGEIPPEFGSLRKLKMLVLSNNNLTGRIPISFGNLSSLTTLSAQFNNLNGDIPSELGRVKGLEVLDLLYNRFSGKLPSALLNFTSLYGFGVGGNLLSGSLPSDFSQNLPNLESLFLYENHFHGPIPLSIINATSLIHFEISQNNFSGLVPANLGRLGNLTDLQLGGNNLVTSGRDGWSFMTTLANCSYLKKIDLSNNSMSGSLPASVANLSSSLLWLRMAGNKITGRIPLGIEHLRNLQLFDVRDNRLSGSIPRTLGNLQQLRFLSLDVNKFSGEIPPILGNLTKITELYLSENSFSGGIPQSFGAFYELNALDLSHNNLNGVIPKYLLEISSLSIYLNLSHNFFVGPLPKEVGNLINLQALDISENDFSGDVPPSLGNCLLLGYLNLQGNNFSGDIPNLRSIKGIELLDLSRNNFHGPIPSFLENLPLLRLLNLSFNNLEGEVPTKGVFDNSSSFSILGNKHLCSDDSKLNLNACTARKHGLSTTLKATITVVSVFCGLFLIACLVYKCAPGHKNAKMIHGRNTSWAGDHLLNVSYAELVDATDGFSSANLIGSGGSSKVYKGILQCKNLEVAIKVFDPQLHGALKGFTSECKFLKGIRHRNLVRILTSCSLVDFRGDEFRSLVYEYMPNGSLDLWLHADGLLDWRRKELNLWKRLGIATDVATALHYLHNGTTTPIDLKPSNVLLDGDMTAHVTDFGIARFLMRTSDTSTVGINGSIGYIAPECGMGSQVSILWDVYSYGILLLEMFTGMRPTDETFGHGMNLHEYVRASFPDRIMSVIDPVLAPRHEDDQMRESICTIILSIMNVALVCSKESHGERVEMQDVVHEMHNIKDAFVKIYSR